MSSNGKLTVADVMTKEFLMLAGMATVAEALAQMQPVAAHFTLIEKRSDADEFGMVLVSDIAKQVLALDRSPHRVNLYEIMSKPVLSVRPGMNIRYCARLFDRFGISTAPVEDNGKIVGVVTYDALVLRGLTATNS